MLSEADSKEMFKSWITAFHRLRIVGFFSSSEQKKIIARILKEIKKGGFTVEDVGFYQYEFKKIEK